MLIYQFIIFISACIASYRMYKTSGNKKVFIIDIIAIIFIILLNVFKISKNGLPQEVETEFYIICGLLLGLFVLIGIVKLADFHNYKKEEEKNEQIMNEGKKYIASYLGNEYSTEDGVYIGTYSYVDDEGNEHLCEKENTNGVFDSVIEVYVRKNEDGDFEVVEDPTPDQVGA